MSFVIHNDLRMCWYTPPGACACGMPCSGQALFQRVYSWVCSPGLKMRRDKFDQFKLMYLQLEKPHCFLLHLFYSIFGT